jgi:hypothetical protein
MRTVSGFVLIAFELRRQSLRARLLRPRIRGRSRGLASMFFA